ncbi:putative membrane protein [Wickerhamomyces ciferrii]|uniref:Membrane protein n=1 Tax=Wickerhamomyces ciferrii (strain ATCC 14091 / BCRC 22168 / CBS 111 / JCM 3599 / NBRC 0793 / NRRL Y-1031 F-60-10) TaxID=1206466 RepID=K0KPE3_WICCF|nr:uncharacterized protein BN7_2560 [Wickerhamomyces ciferrii]CCH43013.1 putative membrane protein [Wickerhamomyces ciferrii]
MDYSPIELPADFDPALQLLNYTSAYGDTQVTFADIDHYFHILMKNGFIFSTRIGAGGLAMIVLFLTSSNRKTPVFILNQLSLLFMVIHSGLYLAYLLGGYTSVTFYFTAIQEGIITDNTLNVSAAANIFQALLILTIEASMVFQIRTIFNHPNGKNVGWSVTGISFLTALATVGITFYNSISLIVKMFKGESTEDNSKAHDAQIILFACSINFMSLILVTKLIMAIRSRRYLGLKQFDSFHILLIMSSQTMIIPSILTIFSYALNAFKIVALPASAVMLVALSLPLSSMWAASANNAPTPTSSGYHVYTPSTIKGSSFFNSDQGTATLKEDAESYRFNRYRKNQFADDAHSTSSIPNNVAIKEDDFDDKDLFTPSTAAEEEAKRYWFANDQVETDSEDEYVSRTTHKINNDFKNTDV